MGQLKIDDLRLREASSQDDSAGKAKRLWMSIVGIAQVDEQSFLATHNRIGLVADRGQKTEIEVAWSIIGRIEAKAGSYLQHISIMIAIIGVMLAVYADTLFERIVLTLEVIAYLVLALMCLRCLFHVGSHAVTGFQRFRAENQHWDTRELGICIAEITLRENWFAKCTRWIWMLTVVFILTVVGHVIYSATTSSDTEGISEPMEQRASRSVPEVRMPKLPEAW